MSTPSAPSLSPTDYPAPTAALPTGETKIRALGRQLPWPKILTVAAIIAVVATGVGAYLYRAAGLETTENAFLEANVHPISPRINGTVIRVLVDDNAHVQAGDPLVEIDPADLNLTVQGAVADLAQAGANAAQVQAQIARAQAGVEAATARIAQNTAQLKRVEVDFHRMETLGSEPVGAISRQEFDAARSRFEEVQATQQSLGAERNSAEAALNATLAQRSVADAQIQKAEVVLAAAKLQSTYTVIRAPSTGRVARKNVEVGQRLQPGQPVMAVVSDHVWVVANFKESQLARLHAGQKVAVKVDAIKGHVFQGVVESFSPGTGAKFSLLAPDNATGNFTKVVQRVPVKIVFSTHAPEATALRLAPGLSAFVEVTTRE